MARFMTGIRVERRVVVVPIAQPVTGCVVPTEDECCDGGSGSGTFCEEGCTSTCPACASMAKRWTFLSPGDEAEVTLCYLESSNDGNPCTFMSEDMTWRLYLSVLDTWTLENLTTGDLFFLSNDDWDCTGLNHMEDALGATAVDVSPVDNCVPPVLGWDCIDGGCVEELDGLYATEADCITGGCGTSSGCCSDELCYQVTISGVTEGTNPSPCPLLGSCASWNQTFHFRFLHDGPCHWQADEGVTYCESTTSFQLLYDSGSDTWFLQNLALFGQMYSCPGNSFSCEFGGLFTRIISNDLSCTSFPTTVTVTRIECPP